MLFWGTDSDCWMISPLGCIERSQNGHMTCELLNDDHPTAGRLVANFLSASDFTALLSVLGEAIKPLRIPE